MKNFLDIIIVCFVNKIYRKVYLASLIGVFLMGIHAHAAIVTVTTNDDELDGDVSSIANLIGTPGGTGISLREAISAANNTPGLDEIRFAASTNGTTFFLTIGYSDEDANADGDLDILDIAGLIITGNGQNNTIIDGNEMERVLENQGGNLTITGLTIQNGNETPEDDHAGGIRAVSGDLTITECTIHSNTARFGAGVYFSATSGTLRLINSSFTENVAYDGSGGAFRCVPLEGRLFMEGCISTGNMAENGAGVDFDATRGIAEISHSIISGNTSTDDHDGGGIRHSATFGSMTISHCEISGNIAGRDGGGIDHCATEGTMTITNTTISGNRANRNGGGIVVNASNGVLNLNFVTITQNIADDDADSDGEGGGLDITTSSSTVNIKNTIIQGNDDETPDQTNADDCGNSGSGTYNSQGGNVVGDGTGCPAGPNDTTDPANLGPLQNNGGATSTHAIGMTSSAYNFSDCNGIIRDQRNFIRSDGLCDSGAYEFGAIDPSIPTLSQWGMILLGLCLLIFGVVGVRSFVLNTPRASTLT